MSDAFDKLEAALNRANRQIGFLCHGFSVTLKPAWDLILKDLLKGVHSWERYGKIKKLDIDPPITFIFYPSVVTSATLPPIMFKQFKAKFIDIINEHVIPAIKIYKQKNPEFDTEIFRPLLTIQVEGKDQ
jgi:hypothetical protein